MKQLDKVISGVSYTTQDEYNLAGVLSKTILGRQELYM